MDELKEIMKSLNQLDDQLEGAAYMVEHEPSVNDFMHYIQRCLRGVNDQLGWYVKTHDQAGKVLNCS